LGSGVDTDRLLKSSPLAPREGNAAGSAANRPLLADRRLEKTTVVLLKQR
jgi:hypothetical protein